MNLFKRYIAGSEYHYYVKDWQGSVRAIIDEEGELKQTVDYSAYGVPLLHIWQCAASRKLFYTENCCIFALMKNIEIDL